MYALPPILWATGCIMFATCLSVRACVPAYVLLGRRILQPACRRLPVLLLIFSYTQTQNILSLVQAYTRMAPAEIMGLEFPQMKTGVTK